MQNSSDASKSGTTGNATARRGRKPPAGHPFTRIIFGRDSEDARDEVNINHSSFSGHAPVTS